MVHSQPEYRNLSIPQSFVNWKTMMEVSLRVLIVHRKSQMTFLQTSPQSCCTRPLPTHWELLQDQLLVPSSYSSLVPSTLPNSFLSSVDGLLGMCSFPFLIRNSHRLSLLLTRELSLTHEKARVHPTSFNIQRKSQTKRRTFRPPNHMKALWLEIPCIRVFADSRRATPSIFPDWKECWFGNSSTDLLGSPFPGCSIPWTWKVERRTSYDDSSFTQDRKKDSRKAQSLFESQAMWSIAAKHVIVSFTKEGGSPNCQQEEVSSRFKGKKLCSLRSSSSFCPGKQG